MGRGQRHSKNAGVMGSEGLTYNEKRALGFGTVRERVGKESQGNYYDCCLTLQPAVDPVCTTHGYLFSREAILENLLEQRKANKRKLAAWQAQQDEQARETEEQKRLEKDAALLAFQHENHLGNSSTRAKEIEQTYKERMKRSREEGKAVKSVVNIETHKEQIREMKSFWHPSMAPESRSVKPKPEMETLCPASGMRLRMKELVPVHFTPIPEKLRAQLKERLSGNAVPLYMDPISRETLTNASRLVLLKPTGTVLTKQSYERCVKPDGLYEGSYARSRFTGRHGGIGKRIHERDVIELKSGGTGFVARDGSQAEAKRHFALGPGSGLTDLRGQTQGPRSHGGLHFWN